MTYAVTVHDVAEATVVSIRGWVPDGMLADFFGKSLFELTRVTSSAGAVTRGSPFAIYHAFSEAGSDIEVALPVTGWVVVTPPATCRTVPAMRVARTVHLGPYGRLTHAYAAVQEWIAEHGYKSTGPVQEHYLTGPDALPEDYWTVVEIPISPALIPVPA